MSAHFSSTYSKIEMTEKIIIVDNMQVLTKKEKNIIAKESNPQ